MCVFGFRWEPVLVVATSEKRRPTIFTGPPPETRHPSQSLATGSDVGGSSPPLRCCIHVGNERSPHAGPARIWLGRECVVRLDEPPSTSLRPPRSGLGSGSSSVAGPRHANVESSVWATFVTLHNAFPKDHVQMAPDRPRASSRRIPSERPPLTVRLGIGPKGSARVLVTRLPCQGVRMPRRTGRGLGLPVTDHERDGSIPVGEITGAVRASWVTKPRSTG